MKLPNFDLTNNVVLITGAASGIGQGLAIGLGKLGVAVGCLDRNSDALQHTVCKISDNGGKALALEADVCDQGSIASALKKLESAFGALNGAINCAGINNMAPSESMDLTQWQRVIDINLTGVFLCAQATGRALIKNGGGSLINIGSISAHIVNRGFTMPHYIASKAGVAHLSRALAVEWAEHKVRVNTISPGYTRTQMATGPEFHDQVQKLINDIPLKRMCEVDELLGPAVFLLSDASSYCTGHDLVVDGGVICW